MAATWRRMQCWSCQGYGFIASYSHGDFEGGEECATCGGCGYVSVLPNDRVFAYPGGPARGSIPGGYTRAFPIRDVSGVK